MPKRAYTLAEIDEMRALVRELILNTGGTTGETEDRLRTYMLAGISPAEIEEAIAIAKDEIEARMVAKVKERRPGAEVSFTNWRGEDVTY